MRVFFSWSGDRSRAVAEALREWIPTILQSVEVWMSAADMGIVCLTPENLTQPWILFETGAIAKQMSRARVCTYLFALEPQDVPPPLGLFQHTTATLDDTRKLIYTLNNALERPVAQSVIDTVLPAMWPTLKARLGNISLTSEPAIAARPLEAMVAELLDIGRSRESKGWEVVLAKLEHIELAMFLLSYRSLSKAVFEESALTVLTQGRAIHPVAGIAQPAIKKMWENLRTFVEQEHASREAKNIAKAAENNSEKPPSGKVNPE